MLKKLCDGVSTAIIVLLILLVAALLGCNLFGVKAYSVLSGSMEPALHTGSLVYVKATSAESMQVGDPVTFRLENGTVATHRIVSKDDDARKLVTKGDANAQNDRPISFDDVIGKVVFTVPLLGYLASFVSATGGKVVVGCVFLVAVILMALPEVLRRKGRRSGEPDAGTQ